MRPRELWAIVLTPVAFVTLSASSVGAEFRRIATIQIPGNPLVSFDIGWVNRRGTLYLLTDRSNASVDFFDTRRNTYEGSVGGFVGVDPCGNPCSGPNGVLTIESQGEAWASDGDSTVKVIDLRSMQVVDTIDTGGTRRADEMAYDPRDHVFVVANNEENPPYLTFIDTRTRQILEPRLNFPNATDGLEQPLWDGEARRFLQAVPASVANPGGEIAVIDPLTHQVTDTFPIPMQQGRRCSPHGIDMGPRHEFVVGCSLGGADTHTIIMSATDGRIVAVINEVGASDEVWFNRGDGNYYLGARNFPAGPVLGIIDSETNTWVENVPTAFNAHSVAATQRDDHVFVPLTPLPSDPECQHGCIGVYAGEDEK